MATATFIKTGLADKTSQSKSQAIIEVDGEEVTVDFWYELIDQWGKDGTKQFLCAEALLQKGFPQDAIDTLSSDASGTITLDNKGIVLSDTRTWQQRWIDDKNVITSSDLIDIDPLA